MAASSFTGAGGWRGGFISALFFTGACVAKAVAVLICGLHPALAIIGTMAALNSVATRTPSNFEQLSGRVWSRENLIDTLWGSNFNCFGDNG